MEIVLGPATIPCAAKLLFSTIKLKPGVTYDNIEWALAEICNVVEQTYGGDKGGFIAGQVLRFSRFVSEEGSLECGRDPDHDLVITAYWRSFGEHGRSHAGAIFRAKFVALAQMCTDTREPGYDMMWQGVPEAAKSPSAVDR
jgi:hypothetical protein